MLPDAGGQRRRRASGASRSRAVAEEGAEVIGQGMDVDEELGAAGNPLALVEAQAAGGDQVVDVGMIDEGAAPGVEDAEHAEGGAQAAAGLAASSCRAWAEVAKSRSRPTAGWERIQARNGSGTVKVTRK